MTIHAVILEKCPAGEERQIFGVRRETLGNYDLASRVKDCSVI